MKRIIAAVTALSALLLAGGCAVEPPREPRIVKLTPNFQPARFKSAAVFNFRLQEGYKGEGPALADYSADMLIRNRVVEDASRVDRFVDDPAEAAAIARREMKQVALLGSIDDYAYGGLTTESHVSVTYTLVEAATGRILAKLRGGLGEPPRRAQEKFFYVDSGRPAPMPMTLARKVVDALTFELSVKPPPPPPPLLQELPPNPAP